MKKIICLCILLFGVCACDPVTTIELPTSIQAYLSAVNEQHTAIQCKDLDIKPFEQHFKDTAAYYEAMEYVMAHRQRTNGQPVITQEEALQDCDDLFWLLASLYGKYPVEGSERFAQAKQHVITQLKKEKEWKKEAFAALLRDALSFLDDTHFSIDYMALRSLPQTYQEKGNEYQSGRYEKREDGYYDLHNGKRIKSIQRDVVLEHYLKPVLQKDGSLTYSLFFQSEEALDAMSVTYADGQTRMTEVVVCQDMEKPETKLEETSIQGIPYLRLSQMIYPKASSLNAEYAKQFLEGAKQFAKSPIAILDLRGNLGGNAMLSYAWGHAYAKEKLNGYGTRLLCLPMEDVGFRKLMNETDQELDALFDYASYQKQKTMLYVEEGAKQKLHTNDGVLLVLQNKNSASASEMLIDQLHTVENVIFIGTPTQGAITGSAMSSIYLDKSGIQVSFGNLYAVFDENYAKEGYGIAPDVWVNGKDTLEYVKDLLSDK